MRNPTGGSSGPQWPFGAIEVFWISGDKECHGGQLKSSAGLMEAHRALTAVTPTCRLERAAVDGIWLPPEEWAELPAREGCSAVR
jgi:hypothetical protein